MSKVIDYYYLTKPGIIYGNLMTTIAGFLLAAEWNLELSLLFATLGGTTLVIASACVFNNYLDQNIDRKMGRTKQRALVTGVIPGPSALLYAILLGGIGFTLLMVWVNTLVVTLGIIAFIDYIVFYGLAKRRTLHGTLVGTIAGAIPLVAGYVAVTNNLDVTALLLFLIMTAWQMAHFYAIALYRLKDYAAAGIPVLPLKRSIAATQVHILAWIVLFIICTALLSACGATGSTFLIIMTLIGLWWFDRSRQEKSRLDVTVWAKAVFGRSLFVLLLLSALLTVGSLLP